MKTLILGATGATGSELLNLLLADNSVSSVEIFVRRKVNFNHTKLRVHIIDFDRAEEWESLVKGDVLFSCLGTTLKDAGSKEAQWRVDHDYQLLFAQIAKKNNVPKYILVSSDYANSKSPLFYSRMKGVLEDEIKALQFEYTRIFNPPLLERRNTDRLNEKMALQILKGLNKFGLFHTFRPLPTHLLAKALLAEAKRNISGTSNIRTKEIWDVIKKQNYDIAL